jgi:cyclic pyranopterin phosphate synthase
VSSKLAVDRSMRITDVHVLGKHGGKSGSYIAAEPAPPR